MQALRDMRDILFGYCLFVYPDVRLLPGVT
jgi:hypothetical protein